MTIVVNSWGKTEGNIPAPPHPASKKSQVRQDKGSQNKK